MTPWFASSWNLSGPIDAQRQGLDTLAQAAYKGHLTTVRVLAELGADPTTPKPTGFAAIHGAAEGGKEDVVRALIDEYQISPMTPTYNGWTPCTALRRRAKRIWWSCW